MSSFCQLELTALAEALELYENLHDVLGRVEIYPGVEDGNRFYFEGVLLSGWIGYNEDGCAVFEVT